jgi:tetratricopeptide (TPR) repeat protein
LALGQKRRKKRADAAQRPPVVQKSKRAEALPRLTTPAALLACGLLIVLVLLVYAQVRTFQFVYLDDHVYVLENAHVLTGLSLENVSWAMTAQYAGNWHPLTWISHMADVAMYGSNAGGHHFTSVFLHCANTVLLFTLWYRATGGLGQSVALAAFFAIHPLHVESVAWVSERKDVLSTLFWIAALHFYVSYTRRRAIGWYIATVVAFGLGLMSKPMVVTLPLTLLLMDYWPLRRVDPDSPSRWRTWQPLLLEKLPLFLLTLASMLVTFKAQRGEGAVVRLEEYPISGRIMNAVSAYLDYAITLVWPRGLAGFYPFAPRSPLYVATALIFLVSFTFLAIKNAKRRPYIAMGWVWYVATLVPVIGLVQVGDQARADRYTYVPMIGLFAIIVAFASELSIAPRIKNKLLIAAASITVGVWSIMSFRQAGYWRDNISLFTRITAVTDRNYRAEALLGVALAAKERHEEALKHYNASLAIWKGNAEVYTNMGASLVAVGKPEEALAAFAEAIHYKPAVALYHYNYGVMLDMRGRTPEALDEVRRAAELDPSSDKYRNGVAVLTQKIKG